MRGQKAQGSQACGSGQPRARGENGQDLAVYPTFWRSSQSYVDNLANRRDADDIRRGLRHVGTGTSPPKTFTSSTL